MKATLKLLIALLLIPGAAVAQEHQKGTQQEKPGEMSGMKMQKDGMTGTGMMQQMMQKMMQKMMQSGMMQSGMMQSGMMGMNSEASALKPVMRRVRMFQPQAVLKQSENLDLTESQKTELQKLAKSAKLRKAANDSLIRKDTGSLAKEFDSEDVSSKTVNDLVKRIHRTTSELQAGAMNDVIAVRRLLSPSQRERVVAGCTMGMNSDKGASGGTHEQHHK